MTSVKDIHDRLLLIEGKICVFRAALSPIHCHIFDVECDRDEPPLLGKRVVVQEDAWVEVQSEIEGRIAALEAEREALEAMPFTGVGLPESPGLGEAVSPPEPPSAKRRPRRRQRSLHMLVSPASQDDQTAA